MFKTNEGTIDRVLRVIVGLALIAKHWQNLQRLMAGQESKIGSKKKG